MEINKELMTALDSIESKLSAFAAKSAEEGKIAGTQSAETKSALEALGTKQRELADEILQIKQRSVQRQEQTKTETWGDQFIKGTGHFRCVPLVEVEHPLCRLCRAAIDVSEDSIHLGIAGKKLRNVSQ